MAQAGAAAQAVKTRARARGRVRLWTLVTAAVARNERLWLNQLGHSYGSCKGKYAQGYDRAETEVQAEALTAAVVAALAAVTNCGRGSRGSGGSELR